MLLPYLDILIGFATVMLGVSLIITILTQVISSALGLRGTNLRWGMQTLLESASPTLKAHAKDIAHAILHHRLISDSTFSKFRLFKRWRLANAIRNEELTDILDRLANQPNPPEWAAVLKANLAQVKKTAESWLDYTMDRVSQRFAMSVRYWTVAFSVLMAMGLHLDAAALFKKLSEDPAARAKLVASAEAVVHETANVLGADGATNVFRSALEQLRKNEPDNTKALTNPPPILTMERANLWVRTQLRDDPNAERLLLEYRHLITSNTIARAPELMGSIGLVRDELAKAGVPLIPDYTTVHRYDYYPTHQSFWGMLISAALLSLGAPFWFNAMKTLLSLRPILAKRVQREAEESNAPK